MFAKHQFHSSLTTVFIFNSPSLIVEVYASQKLSAVLIEKDKDASRCSSSVGSQSGGGGCVYLRDLC